MFSEYDNLSGLSRVWIYQSDRTLAVEERNEIDHLVKDFITSWTAHNNVLKGFGKTFHNRFVVLMVDQTANNASGCSIDKSFHFIQELQNKYNINLLDRFAVAYLDNDHIEVTDKNDFVNKISEGQLSRDTIIFNNLIASKEAFEKDWTIPASRSWIARFIKHEA